MYIKKAGIGYLGTLKDSQSGTTINMKVMKVMTNKNVILFFL